MAVHIKVAVVIERGDQILLIKEYSDKKDGYFWNTVKGTYDNPKETLQECAEREVKEEVGIKVEIENMISSYIFSFTDGALVQYNFLAKVKKNTEPKKLAQKNKFAKGEDILKYRWFDKKEALSILPDELISERAHKLIVDWTEGKKYSVETIDRLD
jgi:ADP-ribose pyrophosphatase YjhB (NUDIX family)